MSVISWNEIDALDFKDWSRCPCDASCCPCNASCCPCVVDCWVRVCSWSPCAVSCWPWLWSWERIGLNCVWKKDWSCVISDLTSATRLNSEDPDALLLNDSVIASSPTFTLFERGARLPLDPTDDLWGSPPGAVATWPTHRSKQGSSYHRQQLLLRWLKK